MFVSIDFGRDDRTPVQIPDRAFPSTGIRLHRLAYQFDNFYHA